MSDSDESEKSPGLVGELDFSAADFGTLRLPPEAEYVEYTRDLTEADLDAVGTVVQPVRVLQRIHASHHSVARCLAMGLRENHVALVTGYSPGRIQQLKKDPTFCGLMEDYKREAKSVFGDIGERMADISLDAIEVLHERLQNNPQDFSIPMLLDVVKAFADRTGHGPGQEITMRVDRDYIDRPPRESFEEWEKRRKAELDIVESMPKPKELKHLN